METDLIFVYGTLKRNALNLTALRFHQEADFLGEASVSAQFCEVGEYLGVILDEKSTVQGEIFRLKNPEKTMPFLDEYEDYFPDNEADSLYLRKMTTAIFGNETLPVWVYVAKSLTIV